MSCQRFYDQSSLYCPVGTSWNDRLWTGETDPRYLQGFGIYRRYYLHSVVKWGVYNIIEHSVSNTVSAEQRILTCDRKRRTCSRASSITHCRVFGGMAAYRTLTETVNSGQTFVEFAVSWPRLNLRTFVIRARGFSAGPCSATTAGPFDTLSNMGRISFLLPPLGTLYVLLATIPSLIPRRPHSRSRSLCAVSFSCFYRPPWKSI